MVVAAALASALAIFSGQALGQRGGESAMLTARGASRWQLVGLAARGRRLTPALASWQISRQPIRQSGAGIGDAEDGKIRGH